MSLRKNTNIMDKSIIHSKPLTKVNTSKRIVFADGLRGFAALWVVFFHMSEGKHIENFKTLLPEWVFAIVFDAGHLGVAVFFVLSGFVMALIVQQATVNRTYARQFLVRRMIRLTPPYFFAIFITLILAFVKAKALALAYIFPGFSAIFAHIFYVQELFSIPHFNIIFWTLCIEVQFYIAFILIFLTADTFNARFSIFNARIVLVGLASMIALLWPLGIISTSVWSGGFLGFWFSFLVGVLVCWGMLMEGSYRLFAILFCLVLFVIGWQTDTEMTKAVSLTGLIMSFAEKLGQMNKWLCWRWIQWLAMISYSLYLLHNPITGLAFRIVHLFFLPGLTADIVGMFATLVTCLIGSYITYYLIERPSIRWSHEWSLSMKVQTSTEKREGA